MLYFFWKNNSCWNINDMSIKEVWNGNKMKKVRDDLQNDRSETCMICQGA